MPTSDVPSPKTFCPEKQFFATRTKLRRVASRELRVTQRIARGQFETPNFAPRNFRRRELRVASHESPDASDFPQTLETRNSPLENAPLLGI